MSELRHALRQLRLNPGFAAVAVLTLALGIGLVSAQFTLVDGVLLRPLPFPDSGRLVHVSQVSGGGAGWQPMSVAEFLDHRAGQEDFEGLAAFGDENLNLNHGDRPARRLRGLAVSVGFFDLLRVPPELGRHLVTGEDGPGQPLRVVLGHALWRDEFGGDPAALGRAVRINGETATIVGVMPPGFRFPGDEECWINLRLASVPGDGQTPRRVQVLGRLLPQRSPREAAARLSVIAERHHRSLPTPPSHAPRIAIRSFQHAHAGSGTVPLLGTMLAMTGLVLVLACLNVANLQLARTAGRLRELAIRTALGADRTRLFRQLLVESLVLAAGGALLGLVLAGTAARLLQTQVATRLEVASWIRFDVNLRVLACLVATGTLAGLLAGLLPALRASRMDLGATMHDGSRAATGLHLGRFGRWLVTAQIAFAGGLVIAAGFLALSAIRSSRANLAFDPRSLLLGRIELLDPRYEDPAQRVRFYNLLTERVQATPGVAAAAVSSRDLVAAAVYSPFEIAGRDSDTPSTSAPPTQSGAWLEVVSRDYFRVIDRGPVVGRLFGPADSASSPPVALVNRSFARRFWPDSDPIGQRLRRREADAPWATVVGVVPDLGMEGVGNNDPAAGWYLLQDQQAWGWLDLLVRTETDPRALIPAVRAAVAQIDPNQPIHTVATLVDRTSRRVAGLEIVGTMAGVFALSAIALAALGIYGVIAFGVERRRREFGIRLALGSTPRGILGLLYRQNAAHTLGGIAVGLALGYLLGLPLAPYLPRVSTRDPVPYALAALALAALAALAVAVPARRAARLDPLAALRTE
jgi:putative ABC transport system permease protein